MSFPTANTWLEAIMKDSNHQAFASSTNWMKKLLTRSQAHFPFLKDLAQAPPVVFLAMPSLSPSLKSFHLVEDLGSPFIHEGVPVPVALCSLGPQVFPVNFNLENLFALPTPRLVPSVDYLLTIPYGADAFKPPFDPLKPMESVDDDSVVEKDFERANIEKVYKLESVAFCPIYFVPPAAVSAIATLDNPDITSVFLGDSIV
jgi:hypothetical protein